MKIGTVKWYDTVRGFGFIEIEGEKDVFVHSSALKESDSIRILEEGQRVQFNTQKGPRGLQAIGISAI